MGGYSKLAAKAVKNPGPPRGTDAQPGASWQAEPIPTYAKIPDNPSSLPIAKAIPDDGNPHNVPMAEVIGVDGTAFSAKAGKKTNVDGTTPRNSILNRRNAMIAALLAGGGIGGYYLLKEDGVLRGGSNSLSGTGSGNTSNGSNGQTNSNIPGQGGGSNADISGDPLKLANPSVFISPVPRPRTVRELTYAKPDPILSDPVMGKVIQELPETSTAASAA